MCKKARAVREDSPCLQFIQHTILARYRTLPVPFLSKLYVSLQINLSDP